MTRFLHQPTESRPSALPSCSRVLIMEVILGAPNRNCAGSGICRLMAIADRAGYSAGLSSCPRSLAIIHLSAQGEHLRFLFLKSAFCALALHRIQRQGCFLVEESFRQFLPAWKEQLHIEQGRYPVWESSRFLVVDFSHPL